MPSLLGPELRRAGPAPVSARAVPRGRGAPWPRRALLCGPREGTGSTGYGQHGLRAGPARAGTGPGRWRGGAERGGGHRRAAPRGEAGAGAGAALGRGRGRARRVVVGGAARSAQPCGSGLHVTGGRDAPLPGLWGRVGSLFGPFGLLKPHQRWRLLLFPVRSARGHIRMLSAANASLL